jgi:hypothetical protein
LQGAFQGLKILDRYVLILFFCFVFCICLFFYKMNTADGVTPASPLPVEGEPAPAEPAAVAARTGEEEPKKKEVGLNLGSMSIASK